MNEILGLVLLNVFSASPEGKSCHIDSSGYVVLEQTVKTQQGTQRLIANIGQESRDDPYRFREICDKIKTEVRDKVSEQWEDYGCDGTMGVQRKIIIVNLSPEGQRLIGGRNQGVLVFTPIEPINRAFLNHYEDYSCDPL